MKFEIPLGDIIQYAKGEKEADLLLKNAQVVNVFTNEISKTSIAIADGLIVGLGKDYKARETVDLAVRIVCPGFIDGHLHIESTLLTPYQFARAVVPHGTTAVVCDPHEIANVWGMDGIKYMLDASEGLPLSVFIMGSSCVPATHLENAGASLPADDLAKLFDNPRVLGLAEMMNYPGVLFQVQDVLQKMEVAHACGVPIDGHSPGLTGRDLQAYIAAGARSDHECTKLEEAQEKLRAGMYIYIREGSTEHNLVELLPIVKPETARRCLFVSDDRCPKDLVDKGHMDYSIRLAVENGLNPLTAIQMVTLNTAERFRLWDRGAVAPGYRADLVILDDLKELNVEKVYSRGLLVAEDGEMIYTEKPKVSAPPSSINVDQENLSFKIRDKGGPARVIGIVEGQITTEALELTLKQEKGLVVSDPDQDILKIAVIERHNATGNIGLGFVKGFGLKRGALASTVAHDSHNIIIVGVNDSDMASAVQVIAEMGGGLVAIDQGKVLGQLPLPVAGLMSNESLEAVNREMEKLIEAAHNLGSNLSNPFMTLSFLALPVIPSLKLTDKGLIDVNIFEKVQLFI